MHSSDDSSPLEACLVRNNYKFEQLSGPENRRLFHMKAATENHVAGGERRKVEEMPTKRLDGTERDIFYFPSNSFPPLALYNLQQPRTMQRRAREFAAI